LTSPRACRIGVVMASPSGSTGRSRPPR
jgi:hypothetical protein